MGRRIITAVALVCAIVIAAAWPASAQDGEGPVGTYFQMDSLNTGLENRPDYLELSTPQGAIETFLDLIDVGDPAVAHVLNMNGLDEVNQPVLGPRLARQLAFVLDRQALISWRLLLERPDALNAQQANSATMSGEPRRSILLGVLDDGPREAAVRLSRVRVGDAEPIWIFSERTVDQIPDLYAQYGPSWLENVLPDVLKRETFLGPERWELIGIPVIVAITLVSGLLAYRGFHELDRFANSYWSRITLRALRWPLIIFVVTTVLLIAAMHVFTVSGMAGAILTPLTVIGYTTAVLLFALEVIDTVLDRIVTFDSEKLADPDNSTIRNLATVMTAGRRALIVIGLMIAAGVVMSSANLFRSLGFSLLASAGALTLILGFAARTVLGNILASLQIALNRSARIGDQLIFDGTFCNVERIHFTFVQLKTWNGQRKVVPVSYFVSKEFENLSMEDGASIRFSVLTFAQEADVDALRDEFIALCEEDDRVEPKDRVKVIVLGQDAFGQQVRFEAPIPDQGEAWATECDLREAMLKAARRLEDETGKPVLPSVGMDDAAA